jgi:hypothetical protein
MKKYIKFFFIIGLTIFLIIGLNVISNPYPTAQPPPFGEVSHICWVVSDIFKFADYWQKIGFPKISIVENNHINSGKYKGKKLDTVVNSAEFELEGVGFEIFQPVKGGSPFSDFLKKHGEGINHIAFTSNDKSEFENQISRLNNMGIEIQAQGTFKSEYGEATWIYFDTESIGGIIFELMYVPPNPKGEAEKITSQENKFPYGKITQFGLVVKDVDRVCNFYEKIGFKIRTINRDNKGLLRRYKGVEKDIRMSVGWSNLGSIPIEIIQPTKERSVYNDFLEKHGEGMQHFGFNVENIDTSIESLKKSGIENVQDGAWGKSEVEGRFAYMNTEPVGGLCIELLWNKK